MRRNTSHTRGTPRQSGGYLLEDSWVDYSDGQSVTYSTHAPDPIPLGIVKLERDASLSPDGPYALYVVVHVKKRNDWGAIQQFDIWKPLSQKSPYRLEDARAYLEQAVRGGRMSS